MYGYHFNHYNTTYTMNIFKLNESTGMLEEQPRMKEPHEFDYKGHKSNFRYQQDMIKYNEHIASLRKLSILPEHKEHFKAGVEYVEGKDLTIRECPCKESRKKGVSIMCFNCTQPTPVAIPTTEREQEMYMDQLMKSRGRTPEYTYTGPVCHKECKNYPHYETKHHSECPRYKGSLSEKHDTELQQLREENERLKKYEAIDNDSTPEQMVEENFKVFDEIIPDADLRHFYKRIIETCIKEYAKRFTQPPSPDATRVAVAFAEWVRTKIGNGIGYDGTNPFKDWTIEGKRGKRFTTDDIFDLFHSSTGDKGEQLKKEEGINDYEFLYYVNEYTMTESDENNMRNKVIQAKSIQDACKIFHDTVCFGEEPVVKIDYEVKFEETYIDISENFWLKKLI